jgi:hypothetical protein
MLAAERSELVGVATGLPEDRARWFEHFESALEAQPAPAVIVEIVEELMRVT